MKYNTLNFTLCDVSLLEIRFGIRNIAETAVILQCNVVMLIAIYSIPWEFELKIAYLGR